MKVWSLAWSIITLDIMQLVSSLFLRSPTIRLTRKAATGNARCAEYSLLPNVIVVEGPVCKGYGRGSKQLGFPTANLPQFDKELSRHGVNRGIYFGWCNIGSDKQTYPCVANIGISPTFVGQENAVNIIESYVLNRPEEKGDFYDQQFRLALVGYIRPEMKFSGLDALISQISSDVEITKRACGSLIRSEERETEQAVATIVQHMLSAESVQLRSQLEAASSQRTITSVGAAIPAVSGVSWEANVVTHAGDKDAGRRDDRLLFALVPVHAKLGAGQTPTLA